MVNWEKSDFQPSNRVQYLGMMINTPFGRVFPSQAHLDCFWEVASSFLHLPSPPARMWQQLLGHMASLELFLPRGSTCLRTLQWQLKDNWSLMVGDPASPIHLSQACVEVVQWWLQEDRWMSGVPLQVLPLSLSGWGPICSIRRRRGSGQRRSPRNTNVLKMRAVELALATLLPQLAGQSVVLMSDNASFVVYLRHQGSTVSRRLCLMASVITQWTERHSVRLDSRYIPGNKNILADQLSRPDQVFPTEWSLLPRVFEGICRIFGRPHLDLFATRVNAKLALYVSPIPDPLA